jgi:hypothetical protein
MTDKIKCRKCNVEKNINDYYHNSRKCKQCYINKIMEGYKDIKEKRNIETQNKKYFCDVCEFVTYSPSLMDKHNKCKKHIMRTAGKHFKFVCELCDFKTEDINELVKHSKSDIHFMNVIDKLKCVNDDDKQKNSEDD